MRRRGKISVVGNVTSKSVKPEVLLATLGVEPQVVTITLDELLARGCSLREVSVVYTMDPGVKTALTTIEGEFDKGLYTGVLLRKTPVLNRQAAVVDFRSEDDLRAVLRTLYAEMRRARQNGVKMHLALPADARS